MIVNDEKSSKNPTTGRATANESSPARFYRRDKIARDEISGF